MRRIVMLMASLFFSFCILMGGSAFAAGFTFNDFSDISKINFYGSAKAFNNGSRDVIRLTDDLGQAGGAFHKDIISLAGDASFNTSFAFQISNPMGIGDNDGQGADGLVFVIKSTSSKNLGYGGGGLGYNSMTDSVGIEYDTWFNAIHDDDGNHVGIDIEGSPTSVARKAVDQRMNEGDIWYSWIDYYAAGDLLEVRLSQTSTRPTDALLSHTIDLDLILGSTDALVGFTSGTGGGGGVHDILEWDYNPVPEPSTMFLLGSGLIGLVAYGRRLKLFKK